MIEDRDLIQMATTHLKRANQQPDPFAAARDYQVGSLLMIAWELRILGRAVVTATEALGDVVALIKEDAGK